MNDQIKEMLKRNFTIQCRIMHPKLLKPEAKTINGQVGAEKFSAMLVLPKQPMQPALQEMMAFINQAMQTLHPGINPQVLVHPIKDSDAYIRQDGKPNPEYTKGCFWINAASGAKFPPVVVDQYKSAVFNEADIWSGRNAAVNINFYNISGANGGKRGLGVNLNAVMLLEGGEHVAGGSTVDVQQAFGNFQADMGILQQGGQAPAPQEVAQTQQAYQPQQAMTGQVGQQPQQFAQPAPQQQYSQPVPAPQAMPQQQYAQPAQAPQAMPQQQTATNPWNPANPTVPANTPAPQQQPGAVQPANNPFGPNNGNGYI